MAFMDEVFRRQFRALFVKNWIVLSKHPFVSCAVPSDYVCGELSIISSFQLNLLRCFLMPIGFGVFLAVAQLFLNKPNNVSSL